MPIALETEVDAQTGLISTSGTIASPSFSTAKASLLLALCSINDLTNPSPATISNVTGASLAWSSKAEISLTSVSGLPGRRLALYYAVSPAALVNQTVSFDHGALSFGAASLIVTSWTGLDLTGISGGLWDANPNALRTGSADDSSTPSLSGLSTTSANTVLFFCSSSNFGSVWTPSGFTTVATNSGSAPGCYMSYKIVTDAQSSITIAASGDNDNGWVSIAAAAVKANDPSVFAGRPVRLAHLRR